jgi:nucleoside-diphosphate-sugar epimerase
MDKRLVIGFHPRVGKPINCLVTGTAGFIGSHLVDAHGASVTSNDNLKLGRRDNLADAGVVFQDTWLTTYNLLKLMRAHDHDILPKCEDTPARLRAERKFWSDRLMDVTWDCLEK